VSKLLLGVVPPWLSSVFHLGGHRHIQKAADHHRAEHYVRKVLQHLFLPAMEMGFSYCVIAAKWLPPHAVLPGENAPHDFHHHN